MQLFLRIFLFQIVLNYLISLPTLQSVACYCTCKFTSQNAKLTSVGGKHYSA